MQAEWVALNYVPFAERSLEVVVDLYHKTACHKAVINEQVLQNIIKVFFFNPIGILWFLWSRKIITETIRQSQRKTVWMQWNLKEQMTI